MLVILFGTTLEVGHNSRRFFNEHGFELVKKLNYIQRDYVINSRYVVRNESSKEDVLKCDFVYEVNGSLTGFNKSQIIDAVRGRKNCVMTMSPDNMEFIRQIKSLYGDYVCVIYTYIDETCLKDMTGRISNPTDEEIAARLSIGKKIRDLFNSDRALFDGIVIYGGENSSFNFESLYNQYRYILEVTEKRQKLLNDKMYVELPYSGNKDYIFVSYSHLDSEKILPVLSALQRDGYRIWYDEGIYGGDNWSKLIGEKLKSCSNFLLFSSENSVKSKEVESEVVGARISKKKMIVVRLDDSNFDFYLEMYLQSFQNLNYNDDDFRSKLNKSLDKSVKE